MRIGRTWTQGELHGRDGWMMLELAVAAAILASAIGFTAVTIVHQNRAALRLYERAVAMEIADGELERMAAGAWRAQGEGRRVLPTRAEAAGRLPPGRLTVTVSRESIRVEFAPLDPSIGLPVCREVRR